MARKAKDNAKASKSTSGHEVTSPVPNSMTDPIKNHVAKSLWSSEFRRAINIIALAAIYPALSQMILAPVYGSIPSATYHKYIVTASSVIGYAIRNNLPLWTNRAISPFAFWIPSVQFVLLQYSANLDCWGPLVTELLTTFPLITISISLATKLVEDAHLSVFGSSEAAPAIVINFLFTIFQRIMKGVLPSWVGINVVLSRLGLQMAIATLYGLILPQSLFWPAVPSIGFTMIANPHLPLQRNTQVANNTLALYNYTLLERRESLTGYLSVIQDNHNKFRVMRCDHSLLGGEWQFPPPAGVHRPVGEPIYPVFTMLEAVRLIGLPLPSPDLPAISKLDAGKQALAIGLGTGSAPSAFIAHGINTTILELDPVVHYFAGKYFNLPKNHSYFIGDAIDFVHFRSSKLSAISQFTQSPTSYSEEAAELQYDYILHDTFTGGALPVALFTKSFLQSLASLLKPTGVIAINYAGDLDLPSASLVYRTITSIFPKCRIFREDVENPKSSKDEKSSNNKGGKKKRNPNTSPPPSTNDKDKPETEEYMYDGDFTNLVYFCLAPTAPTTHSIKFRKPTEADFLGSGARRHYMMPKHEFDPITKFKLKSKSKSVNGKIQMDQSGQSNTKDPAVLETTDRKAMALVDRYQAQSAFGHWKLMRTVIRPEVWEVW